MANPFFSGRIPQVLLDKIKLHLQTTGETQTELLIRLLRAEVNDNKVDNDNKTDNVIADLLIRVERLEKAIGDNKPDNKADEIKTKPPRASRKKVTSETTISSDD
jgi:hypothetical protein